ncbi:hypothetical protein [Streptomyces sp. NPDC047079]|uniref:hypothetical protein n=1 Tax=Streptomyces sp. NPDC047079 TaxID=3154607 RepID=UPI00340C9A7D
MTTRFDDGPEFEPDDPLAVILRPGSDYLGAPPGRYEAIRRAAARRRVLRAAAGVGVTCAVAALIALPLRLATPEAPASPVAPLAPPPASGRPALPSPSASPSVPKRPEPAGPSPTGRPRADPSGSRSGSAIPTRRPSTTPAPGRGEPSASRSTVVPTPGRGTRS